MRQSTIPTLQESWMQDQEVLSLKESPPSTRPAFLPSESIQAHYKFWSYHSLECNKSERLF